MTDRQDVTPVEDVIVKIGEDALLTLLQEEQKQQEQQEQSFEYTDTVVYNDSIPLEDEDSDVLLEVTDEIGRGRSQHCSDSDDDDDDTEEDIEGVVERMNELKQNLHDLAKQMQNFQRQLQKLTEGFRALKQEVKDDMEDMHDTLCSHILQHDTSI